MIKGEYERITAFLGGIGASEQLRWLFKEWEPNRPSASGIVYLLEPKSALQPLLVYAQGESHSGLTDRESVIKAAALAAQELEEVKQLQPTCAVEMVTDPVTASMLRTLRRAPLVDEDAKLNVMATHIAAAYRGWFNPTTVAQKTAELSGAEKATFQNEVEMIRKELLAGHRAAQELFEQFPALTGELRTAQSFVKRVDVNILSVAEYGGVLEREGKDPAFAHEMLRAASATARLYSGFKDPETLKSLLVEHETRIAKTWERIEQRTQTQPAVDRTSPTDQQVAQRDTPSSTTRLR